MTGRVCIKSEKRAEDTAMKRALLTIPALLLVVGIYLTILLGLVRVSLMVGDIPAGALHALARCGELALGVVLLLGGTMAATRAAVWIFGPSAETDRA
jgi:hypothetical protein